jgi:ATP-binding cassette subfamily F protein uup
LTHTDEGIRLSATDLLERFLFTPTAQKAYVDELSGGERRRLELLLVLADAPNVLLLDEPSNDLDLDTLAVLEEYLDSWPGALVAATHDRYFLDRVCDDVYAMDDGRLRHQPGGWAAYRQARGVGR